MKFYFLFKLRFFKILLVLLFLSWYSPLIFLILIRIYILHLCIRQSLCWCWLELEDGVTNNLPGAKEIVTFSIRSDEDTFINKSDEDTLDTNRDDNRVASKSDENETTTKSDADVVPTRSDTRTTKITSDEGILDTNRDDKRVTSKNDDNKITTKSGEFILANKNDTDDLTVTIAKIPEKNYTKSEISGWSFWIIHVLIPLIFVYLYPWGKKTLLKLDLWGVGSWNFF